MMKKRFKEISGRVNKKNGFVIALCVIACTVGMGMMTGCSVASSGQTAEEEMEPAVITEAPLDSGANNENDKDTIPPLVMQKAEEFVRERFLRGWQAADTYADWRIDSLEHVYTYDDFNGAVLQVYCLNYEFLSNNSEKLLLAGGMSVDGDGWTVTEYPDSNYLIFRQDGEELGYLYHIFENDCYPGDEVFTADLQQLYDIAGLTPESEPVPMADTRILVYNQEGLQVEKPATLTFGNGFSLYLTDDDWKETGTDEWTALLNEQVKFRVEHPDGRTTAQIEQELAEEGYVFEEIPVKGLVKRGNGMVTVIRLNNAGWKICYCFPAEAEEGWGLLLSVIADTFYE